MYLKTNMKRPGETGVITAELDLSYNRARRTISPTVTAAESPCSSATGLVRPALLCRTSSILPTDIRPLRVAL